MSSSCFSESGWFFPVTLILTGLLYGISIALLQLMTPFINALGMESINQGQKLNFGLARGMGSVAYAVICYVLGIITVKAGVLSIPASVTIITVLSLGCLIIFPFVKTQKSAQTSSDSKSLANPLLFFRKYRRFSLVLIGCIFIYLSHVLLNNFNFQIAQGKGGGSAEMGTASAIAAMCELPTLFLFGYIIKKIRCDLLVRFAGIFFVLKALGTFLAPGISMYYGVQVFQMLGWGLLTAASVYYVNAIMEPEDAIKGQAYFTMTYTLGSVIGSFLGGALIDFARVSSMLLFATVSALFGAVIVFIFAERTPLKQINASLPYKKQPETYHPIRSGCICFIFYVYVFTQFSGKHIGKCDLDKIRDDERKYTPSKGCYKSYGPFALP